MSKLAEVKSSAFPKNKLIAYKKIDPKSYRSISKIAKKIRKKTIIHVNATPNGGGVAEILRSQIPIEKSFGLESRWLVIKTGKKFFNATKKIHNLLQGKPGFLSEKEKKLYLFVNGQLKKQLSKFLKQFKSGIVIIHDPQPLLLFGAIPKNFSSVLRLHIDFSSPNPSALEFLRPFIINYGSVIISNKDYLPSFPWLKKSKTKIIYPAIDPFSEKNKPMSKTIAEKIIAQHGINPTNPIISQISRFDAWKDPMGVIKSYYLAKNKIPNLQLALIGFFESQDDPEAVSIFKKIKKYAKNDPDIHLFYSPRQLKNISDDILINAMQTASQAIIQASIREGFGLTITEAMWKEKPVIARITSGSLLQIKNNKNGILINSPEETAEAVIRLLENKKLREKLGKSAKLSAKKRFLMPRFVLDNMKFYAQI